MLSLWIDCVALVSVGSQFRSTIRKNAPTAVERFRELRVQALKLGYLGFVVLLRHSSEPLFCGKTLFGPAWFTSFRLRLRGARQIFALPSSLRDSRLRRSSFTACSPHSKTPFTMAPAACSQSRTEHGGSMGLVIDVEAEARPQRASALHWGRLLWWSGLLRPPFASNPPQPPPPFATKCWRPSGLS